MQSMPDLDQLSIDDIQARLHAQGETTYDVPPEMLGGEAREAAVLVPFIRIEDAWHILYIRRATFEGDRHSGQVAFAGGKRDAEDESLMATALREAQEEVGINPDLVTPIGFLDRFDSVSDYRVLPVVGLVKPPFNWTIDRTEVDEAFTIPLSIVMDMDRYSKRIVSNNGNPIELHSLEWHGHEVWGLTAAMLINLSKRLTKAMPL